MKVLFVSNVLSHIQAFHIPYLKMFHEKGYKVHILTNSSGKESPPYCDKLFDVPIQRTPYNIRNIMAYKIARKIIENEGYDIIHCHTPMGGILARLAARKERKKGTKVIYTAHGFHFFKGAPLANWLVYFPVEWLMAHFTDCLITINNEDYAFAKKRLPVRTVVKTDGVGIDLTRFYRYSEEDKSRIRNSFGIAQDALVLVYIAELSYRKNQKQVIEAMRFIKESFPNVKLFLAGNGEDEKMLKETAYKFGVADVIEFLGFRKDVADIIGMSDIVLSSSRQEGLPVNLMEAMAAGKPIVATCCRGNADLIRDGINGFLVNVGNAKQMADVIVRLAGDEKLKNSMGEENIKDVGKFDIELLCKEMKKLYFTDENQAILSK